MTTYSAILDIPRHTVAYLASLLLQNRRVLGTQTRRRALSVGKQAVLVLRWFLDNTRRSQAGLRAREHGSSCCGPLDHAR